MRHGRRLVFTGAGQPLRVESAEVPPPGPGATLVRVVYGGVCGTDVHRLDGDVVDPPHPISLGHEGVGVVEELGAGRATDQGGTPLYVGDRVYWTPAAPCNRCYYCTVAGDPSSCEARSWPAPSSEPNAASFQEFATLSPNTTMFRIPQGTSSDAVIAFGCAMPTALSGLARLGGVRQGSTVVVQGCGPVGLSATLLAHLGGAAQIIVIGAPAHRLQVASRLGATMTLSLDDIGPAERRTAILEATAGRGADLVVEAAGVLPAFGEGITLLGRNGRYLILGLYSGRGEVCLDPHRLNNLNLGLVGSFASQPGDLLRTIALAQRHGERLRLAELVTHRFPLEAAEEAIAVMRRGEALKAVLTPGAPASA